MNQIFYWELNKLKQKHRKEFYEMKNLKHGTKEESICPTCKESKNSCPMMLSLIRNNNYLKECKGYKGEK